MSNISCIFSGSNSIFAVSKDHTIYGWGKNKNYEITGQSNE